MLSQKAELDRWTPIGPSTISAGGGPATGVLFHVAIRAALPGTIYVSSPTCGVWVSADGGGTWRDASSNLPAFAVVGLAVDGNGHVYAAILGDGVYRSIDGGASWALAGTPPSPFPSITDLLADPVTAGILHVATVGGIYRSVNSGGTWKMSRPGNATSLAMAPGASGTIYAGLPGTGVARTLDGGASGPAGWSTLTPTLGSGVTDVRLALSAADPATIYARMRVGTEHNIYASNDGGRNWDLRSTLHVYTAVIAADDTDAGRVYAAGVDFQRSDDGGRTWAFKPGAHVDHHAIVSDPGAAGNIYTACDGGLYRSHRGDGWAFLGNGLLNVEFYDLAVAPTDPALAIGGTQDNGTVLTGSPDLTWKKITAGDGATVAFDPHDPKVMYAMEQYASSMMQSTDGGQSFRNIGAGLPPGAACPNLHFLTHPVAKGVLLACCGALWRTTMPAVAWSSIFTPPGAPSESVTRCAVGRDDWYYAGTNTGRIYMAKGGDGWQLGFAHPTGARVVDLIVGDEDPAVLFSGFSGRAKQVFRLRRTLSPVGAGPTAAAARLPDLSFGLLRGLDGAFGPLAAIDLGAPLPAAEVRTLALDAMRPHTLYVGTSQGVLRARSGDHGATWGWTDYSSGIARADVRALRVQPSTGLMRAGTFGRGAFQVLTDSPIGSVINYTGRVSFLRVHDPGTGFGRWPNELDGEVVVQLDDVPDMSFGFQLRDDAQQHTRRDMLDLLRSALTEDRAVSIDARRTAPRVGVLIRVALRD